MEIIQPGKFVELTYSLYEVAEPKEILMYKFTAEEPDSFVFGMDNGMLEAFKKNITGLKKGDKFDFTLTPDQAFGAVNPDYIMDFDKSMFEVEGKFDEDKIKAGNTIEMMTQTGQRVPGDVLEVTKDKVKIDFNHPLAGQTIRFEGEVKEVRDATPEELAPKAGGCSSCSCGCGDDDDCDCGDDHGCGCSGSCH